MPVRNNIYPLRDWDLQKVVTFHVGKDAEPLIAHKDLACHYSPVLKAAFNSGFVEGESQIYKLEDARVGVVRLLIKWFYSQTVETAQRGNRDLKSNEDLMLVELWVLADKLLIPQLQNQVIIEIEALRIRFRTTCTKSLRYVYENTPVGCPLRKLLVQQCAFNVDPEWYSRKPEHFPQEMLLELAAYLIRTLPDHIKKEKTKNRDLMDYKVEEE